MARRIGGVAHIKFATPCWFHEGFALLSARPKIAELVFQLYGRTLHPELFEVYGEKRFERAGVGGRPGYRGAVQITSAGHVITWEHEKLILCEVAASLHQPLPKKRRLMSHRLSGEQTDRIECRGGASYEVRFALESVGNEAFAAYQQELELAGLKEGVVHRFESSGRVGLGAMSYVHVQSRDRSLLVQALHTFPDDCAIMKSQSVFRVPG